MQHLWLMRSLVWSPLSRASLLVAFASGVVAITPGCSSGSAQGDGAALGNGSAPAGSDGAQGVNPNGVDGPILALPPPVTSGAPGAGGEPSFGAETVCDDMDNDGNGIIDDVDVGMDGLCDCIHIGFFGQVASDAGTATDSFEAWLIARSGQIPIQHLAATETLTAAWLSKLQVLIVGGLQDRAAAAGNGPAFTADEIAAFDNWIQSRGGGAITLSGYTANISDARPASELLQNTGLSYDLMSVTGAGIVSEGGPPVWLQSIVAPDHPIVEGVTEVGVYYGYPVAGDGTAVLQGDGHVLAMAKPLAAGRVVAFADEWITQDATWSGLSNGNQDPCHQPCDEQQSVCGAATQQCTQCEAQPCSDPNDTDITTCAKGCQPSCDSETQRCATNTQLCETCTQEVSAREQATPRLWLNMIRWLTPDNECKVAIPPVGSVLVR